MRASVRVCVRFAGVYMRCSRPCRARKGEEGRTFHHTIFRFRSHNQRLPTSADAFPQQQLLKVDFPSQLQAPARVRGGGRRSALRTGSARASTAALAVILSYIYRC